ncbi:TnsD family Tn7-like transposition protein [Bacillus andreraoultii]|uniref:TnsD family Tn7-like transposition protein n=1 Tax=Bacillus andreraoultii TaxID=1499685 RepID=UPI0005397212|nr:TnsD family Tn7-like transposition protein [Bacillus andreraoultii]
MIVQFPTPYPDEILYSVFARYHVRSGNFFLKHTMEDLFGRKTASASVMLPSGIGLLAERLPKNTTLNEQMLIKNHTMFPLYTAFLPDEKANSIYEAMISDNGGKIFMQSGLMASAIPQNKYFKYCPICFKEDLNQYGELYWHRIHQLPGNFICCKHQVWIKESTVPIIQSNKHIYDVPTLENCDLFNVKDVINNENIYEEIIKEINFLLNNTLDTHFSFTHYTEFYRKHLIEKGYASINGYVHQEKLQMDFKEFYSDRFLQDLHCNLQSSGSNSWLSNITRKHRKTFHPYYHVLLLKFLQLSVTDIFQNNLPFQPFGLPNWPCLNTVCRHYKKDVIQEITIRSCEKTKKPIGRFTCSICGFSYTRKGVDKADEDRCKYTRVMEFGSVWKDKLRVLLDQGLSYREIARTLKVDTNTVIKYEKELRGVSERQHEDISQKKGKDTNKHRREWLELQKCHPNSSKTQLRKISPATYAFLYRNDREWLNSNSPTLVRKQITNKRVDWYERDDEILLLVQEAFEKLKNNKEKMIRITIKSLGDSIGKRDLLEQHLDKMPKTKCFIEKVKESEEEFRKRRVRNVIKEMKGAGEEIKVWKVLKKARIKSEFYHEVHEIISKCID